MYSISINKSSINNKMYKSFVEIISSHGKFPIIHLPLLLQSSFPLTLFFVFRSVQSIKAFYDCASWERARPISGW